MPNCIVNGCSFRWRKKDPDLALHVFPKDLGIIKTWLLQINQDFGDLDEFCHKILNSSKGTYRICSQHFALDAYEIRGMITYLKRDAVPTIFPQYETEETPPKRRRKNIPAAQPEAATSTSAALQLNSTTFSVPPEMEVPFQPETSHFFTLETNQSPAAASIRSYDHTKKRTQNAVLHKRKPYRARSTRTVGTSMEYFPSQVHRSTQFNKLMGTKDKNLQTECGPENRSIGIQCNLVDLRSVPPRSTVANSGISRFTFLQELFQGTALPVYPYFNDYCQ